MLKLTQEDSIIPFNKLKEHIGHNLTIANYGDLENLAIECECCHTVIYDVNTLEDLYNLETELVKEMGIE